MRFRLTWCAPSSQRLDQGGPSLVRHFRNLLTNLPPTGELSFVECRDWLSLCIDDSDLSSGEIDPLPFDQHRLVILAVELELKHAVSLHPPTTVRASLFEQSGQVPPKPVRRPLPQSSGETKCRIPVRGPTLRSRAPAGPARYQRGEEKVRHSCQA